MTDLVHNLRNPSGSIEGSIRLTAPALVCEFLANYWLDEYANRHKGVTVFLESRESSQFTKESSAFDHLVLKSGIIKSEDLVHRELSPLKLSLCATRDYVNRYGKPEHPRELLKHRFLHLYHHGLSGELEFFRDGEIFTFKNLDQTGFLTDSLLATFNLMLQGRGISLISSGFLTRKPGNYNQVITLLDDWIIPPVPVYLVWRQRKYYSPLFRDFVNFIIEKWNNRDSI
nr:LysR substrate-binding domain-containing protein [Pantoea stewartii]